MKRKLNSLFQIFWVTALCLSLIESFTYSGFIAKHLFINSFVVAFLAVIFGLLVLIMTFFHKDKRGQKGGIKILIFFIIILSLYIFLKIINRLTYDNFVFSKFHIQPNNLLLSVLITFLPVIVIWSPKINLKKIFSIKNILGAFVTLIVVFNIYKIYKIENRSLRFIINHPLASYDTKMEEKLGTVFYRYTQFINQYTQENSRLLMPPQAFPWPQSGNGAFLRYFVYPRKVGNGKEYMTKDEVAKISSDYVLLDYGETETTEGEYTHGWPKFDIPAEKVILMNEDGSYGGEVLGDYRYENYEGKRVWGLIKVKK